MVIDGKPGTPSYNGIGGYQPAMDVVRPRVEQQARCVMDRLGLRATNRFMLGADGDDYTLRLHPVSFVIESNGYMMVYTPALMEFADPAGWGVRVGYEPDGTPTISAQGIVPGPVIEACQRAYEGLPTVDWDALA